MASENLAKSENIRKILSQSHRISGCMIDKELIFQYIRYMMWINIFYLITFFDIMHSFWVISSSKAFRLGWVVPGRVGSGQIKNGYFEWKWAFYVDTLYVYDQYWPSYGVTKNPIYVTRKICNLTSHCLSSFGMNLFLFVKIKIGRELVTLAARSCSAMKITQESEYPKEKIDLYN